MQPRVVILDLETTGLDETKNTILEVGISLFNAKLELIDERSWILTSDLIIQHLDYMEQDNDSQIAATMHQNNGLTAEIRRAHKMDSCMSHAEVEQAAVEWLKSYGLAHNQSKLPLFGSTIEFDRKFLSRQMPDLDAAFHYRTANVSAVKEICRVWRPEVLKEAEAQLLPKKKHRVIDDIHDTKNELRFYLEHVFLATPDEES